MSARDSGRVSEYLSHIVQAIGRINRYIEAKDEAAFLQDEMLQDAVIRNIEIIGEAARNVERAAPEYAALHAEVPWPVVYAMRNRVSHGYFEVDVGIIWRTIQGDLPLLAYQVRAMLDELGDQPEAGPCE